MEGIHNCTHSPIVFLTETKPLKNEKGLLGTDPYKDRIGNVPSIYSLRYHNTGRFAAREFRKGSRSPAGS
jgi:hypothetical protein